jgi:PAS domain S-box-containing protein
MMSRTAVFRDLVDLSRDALWCIEYVEPVVVGTDKEAIIDQIFANECYWAACNSAMNVLYDLPKELDLTRQPVQLYFARSLENEAFIRQIVDADFWIDGVLSTDQRHDGTKVHVANDVRADIKDGLLYRLYGTATDITTLHEHRAQLLRREHELNNLLNAVAEPILIVDRQGVLGTATIAFEEALGINLERWTGRDISSIFDVKPLIRRIDDERLKVIRVLTTVMDGNGDRRQCQATLSPMAGYQDGGKYVLVLCFLDQTTPHHVAMVGE